MCNGDDVDGGTGAEGDSSDGDEDSDDAEGLSSRLTY